MSQDFTENKRYPITFKNIVKILFVMSLMIVSFCVGQHDTMRTAKDKGHAVLTEDGRYLWKR